VESLIRLAAPALDLVLYTGERVSKVVGRNQLAPEPAGASHSNASRSYLTEGRAGLPSGTRH
jgi:hypothetical protein